MKIVLNKSRGRFSLSPEAIKLYGKYAAVPIYFYEQVHFKGRDNYNEWRRIKDTKIPNSNKIYLITNKDYGWSFREIPNDIVYFTDDTIPRTDKNLIKAIEELGPKSFGKGSYLVIEELDNNCDIHIKNENGIETVY